MTDTLTDQGTRTGMYTDTLKEQSRMTLGGIAGKTVALDRGWIASKSPQCPHTNLGSIPPGCAPLGANRGRLLRVDKR
eukprot:11763579-Heterocapsa_arctica.AAC.1